MENETSPNLVTEFVSHLDSIVGASNLNDRI
jgi:hypothetical protein